jgi:hypothetical protein
MTSLNSVVLLMIAHDVALLKGVGS